MPIKITKSSVDALQPGETITDTLLQGFRVRAGSNGKVYSVQKRIHGKVVTRTIGKHGIYTPDEARQQAKKILLQLSQGVDPLVLKRQEAEKKLLIFGHLIDLYFNNPNLSQNTKKDLNRIKKHFSHWFQLPANDITRSMVLAQHEKLMAIGETQAALLARYCRAIFNHGMVHYTDDDGDCPIKQNPFLAIMQHKKMPPPKRRQTLIQTHHFKDWFQATLRSRENYPTMCDYIITTLLLGCRREESASLAWADVDLEVEKCVALRNTKNKTDHILPLGTYLHQLLLDRRQNAAEDDVFVFPGKSKTGHISEPRRAMETITSISGVKFVISDLRRTFATNSSEIDIEYINIKRLLNHKIDNREATPGYIIDQIHHRRKLMQSIEDHFLSLGGLGTAE